ncbi:Cof-type HAD-IIB family hydrolase [Priestia filamentosa]|uniref:Cof-type HAD-IIB family hydrolase n=1 Tax=Priestia filamentosa TaxID=1402861 RepID=UPI00397CDB8E
MTQKIVFLDIDGTILTADHTIPESTKRAVQELKENGIEVVIATGRGNFEAKHIADELEIESLITYNGSYVSYKGKNLFANAIPMSKVNKLIEIAKAKGNAVSCSGTNEKYYTDINYPMVQEALNTFEFKGIQNIESLEDIGEIYQMIVYCFTKEELDSYKGAVSGLKLAPWNTTLNCADVMLEEGSKAEGIKLMLEYLNIDKSEAVAFGDGLNDIEMLTYVGTGVAMGNAHPDVFKFANVVTENVEDNGIYNGLKKIGILE